MTYGGNSMTLQITQQNVETLKSLRKNHFKGGRNGERMFDDFRCFNTWQNNAYLSPEQLEKMEDNMVFYVTLAIVTELFEVV